MGKSKDLARNTGILAAGKAISQLSAVVLIPLYTAHLSRVEYGQLDLILSYVLFLAPVLTIQTEMAMFRLLIDNRGSKKIETIYSSLMTLTATAAILFVVIAWTLNVFFNVPMAGWIIAYSSLTMIYNVAVQALRGVGDNKRYAFSTALMATTSLLGAFVALTIFNLGLQGVFMAMVASLIISISYAMCSHTGLRWRRVVYEKKTLRESIAYSLPLVPNSAAIWGINLSDRTVISAIIGVAANGLYAVAAKFSAVYLSLFGVLYMSWTESVAVHIQNDEDGFINKGLNTIWVAIIAVGAFVLLGTSAAFPYIVDSQFNGAYTLVPMLVISGMASSMFALYGSIYIAKKATKSLMNTTIVAAVVTVVLSIVMTRSIGLFGPPVAMALSYFILIVYRYHDLRKTVSLKIDYLQIAPVSIFFVLTVYVFYLNTITATIVYVMLSSVTMAYIYRHEFAKMKTLLRRNGRA